MSKDCTIQDVFHRFYPSFESTHSISPAQRKAAYHISVILVTNGHQTCILNNKGQRNGFIVFLVLFIQF